MYIVLYTFKIKKDHKEDFIKAWKGLTKLIYKHEGSLGSRLHKKDTLTYIAYAQWPDKTTFDNAGKNLPQEAEHFRCLMKASCEKVDIIEKLDVIEDLLK
ncbi:antibiotic biosynthesis monooxygenase family protein [Corallibacter sp.]|uniref:antibiotic biosynthesis monooxygenase family protein n=1 Tax=Corallibacter sp. TaxID=2038084 RepID=UPI003AB284F9